MPHFHCPEQPLSVLPVKLDRSEARRSLTGKDTIAAPGSDFFRSRPVSFDRDPATQRRSVVTEIMRILRSVRTFGEERHIPAPQYTPLVEDKMAATANGAPD